MRMHLYATAALISVMMLAGAVKAETTSSKTPTPPAASTEQQKPTKSDGPRLSDEKYKILKAAMAKVREDNKQVNEQIKTKRKELAALLGAERFNKSAFLAKHAEMQELITKASRGRTEALATVAEQFNVQDRKILAERLERKKGEQFGHNREKKANDKKEPRITSQKTEQAEPLLIAATAIDRVKACHILLS